MAKSDYSRPLDEVTFRCGPCRRTFSGAPERVEDCPGRDWHPFEYVAACPSCGEEARAAHWWLALLKGWQNATGPRTEAGKAATAANLDGHPTQEESLRTRFNAMKHGLSAKTATYFPASPGKYSFCTGCDVDWGYCASQPACIKQTQLFMQHHAAFEQRNPKHLSGIYADLQAALFAVLQQILQTIIADGVKIEAPQYYTDKEGVLIVAQYLGADGQMHIIKDISAHPLFKPLGELLSRNNLSLADMGMTQKVIDDEEQEFGRLQAQEQSREVLADFARRQAKAMEDLGGLMNRATAVRDRDPILLEHQQQSGG